MSASSAESKKSLLLSRPSPAQSCQPHPIPAPARPPLTPNWGQQLAPWPPHSNETWFRKRLSQPLTIPRFHLPAGWGGRRAPLPSPPELEGRFSGGAKGPIIVASMLRNFKAGAFNTPSQRLGEGPTSTTQRGCCPNRIFQCLSLKKRRVWH